LHSSGKVNGMAIRRAAVMPDTACGNKRYTVAQRCVELDAAICALFNTLSRSPRICALFRIASRLGDGIFWYALMTALPVIAGHEGLMAVAHMAAVSLAGLAIYTLLKSRIGRERPYAAYGARIVCAMPPLDRYSFPSGHTLHAVCFTAVACAYLPLLAWVLVPFALLVALSRLVLGLHYPSDVLAGALIGGALALTSLVLVGPTA
jgi:undecaprenyl-diphosphatase